MAVKSKAQNYKQMSEQLNQLIEWFESDQLNLDEAVGKYEEAMALLQQMDNHLKTAENKIKKIAVRFDSD